MSNGYETYHELARLRAATQRNTAIQIAQTAVLADMNGALDSIHGEMADVRQLHEEGIAAQQAMLQREALQDRLEEFIYQSEKFVIECKNQDTTLPPSSRYFDLLGILERIKYENISTPLIRGRDNKEAFEGVVKEIRSLIAQLKKEPEVQEALAWAKQEQKRRLEDKKKQAAERKKQVQKKINQLNDELRQHEGQPSQHIPTFLEWIIAAAKNTPRNPITIGLLVIPFVVAFLWRVFFHPNPPPFQTWIGAVFAAYAIILLPLYSIIGFQASCRPLKLQNRNREDNISRLNRELSILQSQGAEGMRSQPVRGIALDEDGE